MHINKITNRMLAKHLGLSEEYISMILNGKKEPKGAEERIMKAIEELVKEGD